MTSEGATSQRQTVGWIERRGSTSALMGGTATLVPPYKLPEVLGEAQKDNRIHNLLGKLAKKGKIRNEGSRKCPRWVLIHPSQ